MKLTRNGSTFTAYYSTNGTSWTQISTTATITMGNTIYVGLIASSHSSSQLATATFTNVSATNATFSQLPTVATAAAASPSPVTGTTTGLSVLAALPADSTYSYFTYTWAATALPAGAAPPTFSANGATATNDTTATFSLAGDLRFHGYDRR